MFSAIARKAFRFRHPNINLGGSGSGLDAQGQEGQSTTTTKFEEAYAEILPGESPGSFGPITRLPDWVKTDKMWEWATSDKDIVEVLEVEQVPVAEAVSEEAARQATLAAAKTQQDEAQAGKKKKGQ